MPKQNQKKQASKKSKRPYTKHTDDLLREQLNYVFNDVQDILKQKPVIKKVGERIDVDLKSEKSVMKRQQEVYEKTETDMSTALDLLAGL